MYYQENFSIFAVKKKNGLFVMHAILFGFTERAMSLDMELIELFEVFMS